MTIEEPYGELIDSTLGFVSWNVWGRYGPWQEREEAIVAELARCDADIVVLQESWVTDDGGSQAASIGPRLGLDHWFVGPPGLLADGWSTASAMLSRWPIIEASHQPLDVPSELRGWPGEIVAGIVDGPRGRIPVVGVALDWPPQASALRMASVRDLARRCKELGRDEAYPVVVGGDFNAGPDSAELRALTGEDETAIPGFVLFDAWAKAGAGPGITWDRANRWALPTLFPSRRIDVVLTGWPAQSGGGGDVVEAELLGASTPDLPPSDHYGIAARLRY